MHAPVVRCQVRQSFVWHACGDAPASSARSAAPRATAAPTHKDVHARQPFYYRAGKGRGRHAPRPTRRGRTRGAACRSSSRAPRSRPPCACTLSNGDGRSASESRARKRPWGRTRRRTADDAFADDVVVRDCAGRRELNVTAGAEETHRHSCRTWCSVGGQRSLGDARARIQPLT